MTTPTDEHRKLASVCYSDIATHQDLSRHGRVNDDDIKEIIAQALAEAEERGARSVPPIPENATINMVMPPLQQWEIDMRSLLKHQYEMGYRDGRRSRDDR
jgi:hypothetical protein